MLNERGDINVLNVMTIEEESLMRSKN